MPVAEDIQPGDCWPTVYRLAQAGDVNAAVALCKSHTCSQVRECQLYLAKSYYDQGQLDEALEWFSKAAETGDDEALFGAGSVHFIRKDYDAALQLWKRAADRGSSKALAYIGSIYYQGLAGPRNLPVALDYYKQSAAAGYLLAERALMTITFRHGTAWERLLLAPKFLMLLLRASWIAARHSDDKRLADIPLGSGKSHR